MTLLSCSDTLYWSICETVLVTGDLWTISNSSGSHMSDIRGKAQPWMNLTYANFRCNEIKRIDPAVVSCPGMVLSISMVFGVTLSWLYFIVLIKKLLVNVVTLDLSQNAIAEIDNLDVSVQGQHLNLLATYLAMFVV